MRATNSRPRPAGRRRCNAGISPDCEPKASGVELKAGNTATRRIVMPEPMSRRSLFAAAGTALLAGDAFAQGPRPPNRPPMEPNTIKRRGTGLRAYDPDRAYRGFTLFAPSSITNRTVYLIDMEGNVVHTWEMPYPPLRLPHCCRHALLQRQNPQFESPRAIGIQGRGGARSRLERKSAVGGQARRPSPRWSAPAQRQRSPDLCQADRKSVV